jgi:hypothetical protein
VKAHTFTLLQEADNFEEIVGARITSESDGGVDVLGSAASSRRASDSETFGSPVALEREGYDRICFRHERYRNHR